MTDTETLGRHQHQQPGENTYSLPSTELPPDEPPPPYDAINKDRVILSWDGVTAGPPATQYIPLQAAPSSIHSGNYSQQDHTGGNNQTTQTPLRRSQRSRGSNNRMLDRNNRPSNARSSQRRSNSHALDNDGSPNLTRHRRHGSSGQILDPGVLQRRGSRERVIDRQTPRQSGNPAGPGGGGGGGGGGPPGRPVGGGGGGNPQGPGAPVGPTPHRTQGHQRTGSDSALLDNRLAPLSHLSGDVTSSQIRNNTNNLSMDSSVQRLAEPSNANNSANYYSPPSEISSVSYESMAPSVPNVSQQPRLVLPPMPNRTQQPQQQHPNHLPHPAGGEHPLHVTPRHHQRAVGDNRQYPYHTPSMVNNNHQQQHSPSQQHDAVQQQHGGPLQINTGQLSPRHTDNGEPSFHSPRGGQAPHAVSPHYNPGETIGGPRGPMMRFPRTNPSLPPRSSPQSAREGYQGQPGPQSPESYGLAIRPTVGGTTHGPHSPPLSQASPSLSSSPQSHTSPPISPTEYTLAHTHTPESPVDVDDEGPNQPLEILPTGNATTIWGLDSTTV